MCQDLNHALASIYFHEACNTTAGLSSNCFNISRAYSVRDRGTVFCNHSSSWEFSLTYRGSGIERFGSRSCPQNNCNTTDRNSWPANATTNAVLSNPHDTGSSHDVHTTSPLNQRQNITLDLVVNLGLVQVKNDTQLSIQDMSFVPANRSSVIHFEGAGDWQKNEDLICHYPNALWRWKNNTPDKGSIIFDYMGECLSIDASPTYPSRSWCSRGERSFLDAPYRPVRCTTFLYTGLHS
jgi:hypothetical protein